MFPWLPVGGGTTGNCVKFLSAYNLGDAGAPCGSGGGSGTVSSGTANHFTWYSATGTTVSANANLTEASNALVYAGSSGLSLTGGGSVGGFFDFTQGTAQTGTASHSKAWADTTFGYLMMINGTGSAQKVTGSGVDINTSDQVVITHLTAPLPTAQGGTNTGSPAFSTLTDGATVAWNTSSALLANATLTFTTVHSGSRTLEM